jgi:protein AroM
MTRLGTLTIGQAPRPDVTPIVEAHVPPLVPRLHAGLLDGLGDAEIAARYAPSPGARRLVTRLADGRGVEIDAAAAESGVQAKVSELEAAGCTVILLLCTGVFRTLQTRAAWLIEPDRIVPPLVAGLAGDRRVGVMVPLASQMDGQQAKWSALATAPVFAAATPYADSLDAVAGAAGVLHAAGASIIVMDCIGYTGRHRGAATTAAPVPVLLSSEIVARMTGACLSGG